MHNGAQISNAQIRQDTATDENFVSRRGDPFFYAADDIPKDFNDEYVKIEKSVTQKDFSLQARVMAGLNMASAISFACNSTINADSSANAEDYYVSTRTGDIKIIVETHESRDCGDAESDDGNGSHLDSVPWEAKMLSLVAYLTFRLLCIVDPFDGKQTLVEYPFLSETAIVKIHSGIYGLIVETGGNAVSKYFGSEALSRWNALPSFFREQMVKALHARSDKCEIDSAAWLDGMRKLRDCLVFVKGQYRFCDPDLPINLLFMKTGSYMVPIWPKKALYWYHIGDDKEKRGNGIIAGVNGDGILENYSSLTWCIEYGKMKEFISPKHSVKPESGMQIKINDIIVEIVDGNIASPEDEETDTTCISDTLHDDRVEGGFVLQGTDNKAQQDNTDVDKTELDIIPIDTIIDIDHSV